MEYTDLKSKILFFSIPSPIMMRNYILAPNSVLSYLKNTGMKIVILVPESAYEQVRKDFEKENVVVESIQVDWKKKPLERFYAFIATYLVFTEMQRLLAKYGTRPDIPAAGGFSFLYPIKWLIANTLGKWRWFKNDVMARLDPLVYRARPHKAVFEKYNPDLIFLPHYHCIQDTLLIREAKRQGVQTIGMPGSWDSFVKRYEPQKLDTLLVWNEPVRGEAVKLQGYREENVKITGAPYYDLFTRKDLLLSREAFCKHAHFDPKKKIVFFGSRSKYTPNDPDIISIILDAQKTHGLADEVQVYIRPYPGVPYDHEKFDQFNDVSGVYVDWIETRKLFGHSGFAWYPTVDEVVHFMNCLYHADIVINTYSSISIEAGVFLKPIININFDGYAEKPYGRSVRRFQELSHFIHVNKTRGIIPVNNREELIHTINLFLKNPGMNRVNTEAMRERMCYKTDGKASERIAHHILEKLRA